LAWTLAQLVIDLFLITGCIVMWVRLQKPPQDDPRLSRGLQLLQSKITILEDLSDRTEHQVKQLTQILDQKTRHIQDKILQGESQVLKIEQSMQKSLEVAEIFQDRIPHEEVLERKRTIEYVKAARLSNQGKTLDEILRLVDLPREQVELIAKFNREQLMFDENALPEWARNAGTPDAGGSAYSSLGKMDFLGALDTASRDPQPLQAIERKFKDSVRQYHSENTPAPEPMVPPSAVRTQMQPAAYSVSHGQTVQPMRSEPSKASAIIGAAQSISQSLTSGAANFLSIQENPRDREQVIRKVEFPRIQMPR
jgi:hypothetical protein